METKRLILRDFREEDADDLYAILGDDETMACLEPAYDREKTRAFLMSFCIGARGALAAAHRESGRVIGYILFKPLEQDVYEIGWIFHKAYWRCGFAYEACSAVIDYAFGTLGAHKIVAETIDAARSAGLAKKRAVRAPFTRTFFANYRLSRRCPYAIFYEMKKLGMMLEGVQRAHTRDNAGNWADLYLYGLLRAGWARTAKG